MNIQTSRYVPLSDAEDLASLGTAPIPVAPYHSEAYFELERDAVFKRVWLQIGHVCEVPQPGTFIVRELEFAKASILITRGKDGKIRAFHNVCTHRGTQLVQEASGARASFSCRYHAWTFGYDGELRSAPDFDQFYVDKADCGLKPINVDVCAGLIFVNLAPRPAQPLREFLGPLAEQLETRLIAKATTFSEYVYEIDGNWKLTYDNFQENYHLRFIHPRSGNGAGGPENPFGYPTRFGFHGPHRTQTIWSNPSPQPTPVQMIAFMNGMRFTAAQGFPPGNPDNQEYFALFPNFFMLSNPSQHFTHTVYPISATRSRGVIRLWWIGEDTCASQRFAREYSMATARDIHSEDRAVIEAGQRGISSGALTHLHYQSREALCRHLFNNVDQMVQAYRAERDLAEVKA